MNEVGVDNAMKIATSGADIFDNPNVRRGVFIVAPHGFGIGGGQRPAIVMHPIDAIALRLAVSTGRKMNDLDVMTEAAVTYIIRRAASRARTALGRLDRMVAEGNERTAVQVGMFLHPLEHGMTYNFIMMQAECQECGYVVTDEDAARYGMRAVLAATS